MTKGPDGTTRVITGTANILPKNLQTTQQSLIKAQTTSQQQVQPVQVQQASRCNFCLFGDGSMSVAHITLKNITFF